MRKPTFKERAEWALKLVKRRCPFCGAPRTELSIGRRKNRYGHFYSYVRCGFCQARGGEAGETGEVGAVWEWNHVGTAKTWTEEMPLERSEWIRAAQARMDAELNRARIKPEHRQKGE